MGATQATAKPVGPVTATSGLNVRIRSQNQTTVVIEWDLPPWQEGFLPTVDGSEILPDGKRHPNTSQTQNWVKFSKIRDGRQHRYGVNVLGVVEGGDVLA